MIIAYGNPTTVFGLPGPVDLDGLDTMSAEQRSAFLVGVLDQRDASLINISCELASNTTNVSSVDGSRKFMHNDHFVFRRMGDRLWLEMVNFRSNSPDEIRSHSQTSWDGKEGRGLAFAPYVNKRNNRGTIGTEEDKNLTFMRFNEILGFRVDIVGSGPVSLSAWIKDALKRGVAVEAHLVQADGTRLLRAVVHERGSIDWTIVLDPSKGYAIRSISSGFGGRNGRFGESVHKVLVFRQLGSVWLPSKTVRTTRNSAADVQTEVTYEVEQIALNSATESNTAISWPPNTTVVDHTQNVAYTVRADGRFDLLPLAKPDEGVVAFPTTKQVARVDVVPEAAYRVLPTNLAPARDGPVGASEGVIPSAKRPVPWWRAPASILSGSVVIAVVVAWARSKARAGNVGINPPGSC